MSNIWEHPSTIAMEALTHLEDALVIAPMCAMDKTSEFTTTANGWRKGDTVSFRTHGEYEVKEFETTIETQPISTSTRPMKIEKHFDISVEVTARELALDLDSFVDQVIRPASYSLAEKVDTYLGTKLLEGAGLYVSSNLYGSAADMAQARKAATLQQLRTNRFSLVDLDSEANLLGQDWFNQANTRGSDGERTLREGEMGRVMGMNWFT
ncbi:MAG: P22 phage major capsid protein family protein, partial [Sphaerochaetaceae bacterium]